MAAGALSGRLVLAVSLVACCWIPGSEALPSVGTFLGNAGRRVLRRAPVKQVEIVREEEPPPPPLRRTWRQAGVEMGQNAAAGGMASASVKSLLHPFDVVKTCQQHSSENLSMLQVCPPVLSACWDTLSLP